MEIYTVTQAAAKAGCTVSYVRRLLRSGTVAGKKLGRSCWILEKSEITKLRKTLGIRSTGKKSFKK